MPCHGDTGEGKHIVDYKKNDGTIVSIDGPDIRQSTLKRMEQSIKKGKGIMPKYFLTDKEIKAIHAYLIKVNIPNPKEDK